MPSMREDVQFEGNLVLAERCCEIQAVFNGDGLVIGSVPEKGRRSFRGDSVFQAEVLLQVRIDLALGVCQQIEHGAMVTFGRQGNHRIARNQSIGARALAIDWVRIVSPTRIKDRRCGHSAVAASAEAKHADLLRVDIPGFGVGANQPDGAADVIGRNRIAVRRNTVLNHGRCQAQAVQPKRDWRCLMRGFAAVAAARTDNDAGPRPARAKRRKCHGQVRTISRRIAKSARCAIRPEKNAEMFSHKAIPSMSGC